MHSHRPNKSHPCSLKITVIFYPFVLVMIFINEAIFSKYGTLVAFEKKKPLIIFSIILHMGFLMPKISRSCHKKKCSQEHQIQEIMVCIFNIEWIAWVPKSLLYIQDATIVLEGSLWQCLKNVWHYLKCYKALHDKGITKGNSSSLHSTMRMDEIYCGLLQ